MSLFVQCLYNFSIQVKQAHRVCSRALQALKEVASLDVMALLRGLAHPRRRQLAAPRVHALPRALLCRVTQSLSKQQQHCITGNLVKQFLTKQNCCVATHNLAICPSLSLPKQLR